MKEWVLSLVGMAFLGVLLELILPNGKLNIFIKSIFAIFLLYVIVSPLPNLFNKNITLSTNYEELDNTSFLETINQAKIENYETYILARFKSEGIENVSLQFQADLSNADLIIEKVYVDAANIVLNNWDNHININEMIVAIIKEILGVDEKGVVIYGI